MGAIRGPTAKWLIRNYFSSWQGSGAVTNAAQTGARKGDLAQRINSSAGAPAGSLETERRHDVAKMSHALIQLGYRNKLA